jgi:hypothetical protein
MAALTTTLLVAAAVAGAGATAYSAQQQGVASRRAETRANNIAATEADRQRKADSLLKAKESAQAKQTGGALRATAGARAGRRSLLSGAETGIANNALGSSTTLG